MSTAPTAPTNAANDDRQVVQVREGERFVRVRKSRTSARDDRFFAMLGHKGNVMHACRVSGYNQSVVYRWRDNDPEFGRRWAEAMRAHQQIIEAEIHRRAVEGINKPVYYQGKRVDTIKEYSDRLLELKAKAKIPEYAATTAQGANTGQTNVLVVNGAGNLARGLADQMAALDEGKRAALAALIGASGDGGDGPVLDVQAAGSEPVGGAGEAGEADQFPPSTP